MSDEFNRSEWNKRVAGTFEGQPPPEPTAMPSMQGMSLRDYFASQILNMASHDLVEPEDIAKRAYAVADAMLKARAQ